MSDATKEAEKSFTENMSEIPGEGFYETVSIDDFEREEEDPGEKDPGEKDPSQEEPEKEGEEEEEPEGEAEDEDDPDIERRQWVEQGRRLGYIDEEPTLAFQQVKPYGDLVNEAYQRNREKLIKAAGHEGTPIEDLDKDELASVQGLELQAMEFAQKEASLEYQGEFTKAYNASPQRETMQVILKDQHEQFGKAFVPDMQTVEAISYISDKISRQNRNDGKKRKAMKKKNKEKREAKVEDGRGSKPGTKTVLTKDQKVMCKKLGINEKTFKKYMKR